MKLLNRKAAYDYNILEKFEFGIVLTGVEVKSLRKGDASIAGSHISYNAPHIMIHNMHIAGYNKQLEADLTNRSRVLLVHKKEKNKIMAINKTPGQTVVPLELYWNKKGIAKLLCAIVEGKNQRDKRETIKTREWNRQKATVLKNKVLS